MVADGGLEMAAMTNVFVWSAEWERTLLSTSGVPDNAARQVLHAAPPPNNPRERTFLAGAEVHAYAPIGEPLNDHKPQYRYA